MLDSFRRGAQTLPAKILMGVLVAAFGAWGIADVFNNVGTRSVASVGDTDIEAAYFQRVYQRQIQAFSRQMGQPVTAEMAAAFGLPQRILSQMMADAALKDAAASYGLGLSDATLAKKIADDPSLRPQGAPAFDRTYFTQLLAQNGMSEAGYIADRRTRALREQITGGLISGVATPTALVEAVSRFRNEVRIVDYFTLPRSAVTAPAPTDDELAKWYETNKATFEAPEVRTLSVVALTPETLADASGVSDDDARKEYERTKAQYGTPEARRIQQILYPSVADAEAAGARLKAGTTFEQLAAEKNLKPEDTDLGLMTADKVIDPAVRDAAFKLAVNEISAPVTTTFGGALLRVTEIQPESVKPFEAVSAEIKGNIAKRAAATQVLDIRDEIEDARAGGATLSEVATRFKLKLIAADVDAAGNKPDGGAGPDLPEKTKLLQAAFQADEGGETDALPTGGGYVWYSVDKVAPAHDRPLAEVKDKAVAAWTAAKVDELLAVKANDLLAKVKAGTPIADVAREAGLTVATTEAFARNAERPELGTSGVDAAFGGPQGHAAAVEGPDGSRVVLQVKSAVVPPFFAEEASAQEAAKQFRTELEASLEEQYVEELKQQLGSTVNQAMLDATIGLGSR